MDNRQKFSWRARLRSFRYAGEGIKALFRDEHNARIHAVAAVLAIAFGFIFRISSSEWCAVIILIGAVYALEAVNTAIEAIADKVSPQFAPLIKKAKDTAAAAVLIMAVAAVAVAAVIFLPRFMSLFE